MNKFNQKPNSIKSNDVPVPSAKSQDDRAKQPQESSLRSFDKQNAEPNRQVKQDNEKGSYQRNVFSSNVQNLYPNQAGAGHKAVGPDSNYSGKSANPSAKQQLLLTPRARKSGASSLGEGFAAAKQQCDLLTGDAKERCIKEARARFGLL